MPSARAEESRRLDRVSDHAGIARHAFAADELAGPGLKRAIEARFPDFENNGWRFESSYVEPLPEALRGDMARFFAPFNELLYALVGRRFGWPGR